MIENHNGSEIKEERSDLLDKNGEESSEVEDLPVSDEFVEESDKELNKLRDKIVELESVAASNWDQVVRVTSELENFRRRAERDLAKTRKFSIEGFVKSLMPVLDSLEQASDTDMGDGEHLKEGMELTLKLFMDTLAKNDVQLLDPKGEMFDPTLHEAMSLQQDPNVEPGTILTVFQKGYQLAGRVIRPARVVVASKVES